MKKTSFIKINNQIVPVKSGLGNPMIAAAATQAAIQNPQGTSNAVDKTTGAAAQIATGYFSTVGTIAKAGAMVVGTGIVTIGIIVIAMKIKKGIKEARDNRKAEKTTEDYETNLELQQATAMRHALVGSNINEAKILELAYKITDIAKVEQEYKNRYKGQTATGGFFSQIKYDDSGIMLVHVEAALDDKDFEKYTNNLNKNVDKSKYLGKRVETVRNTYIYSPKFTYEQGIIPTSWKQEAAIKAGVKQFLAPYKIINKTRDFYVLHQLHVEIFFIIERVFNQTSFECIF